MLVNIGRKNKEIAFEKLSRREFLTGVGALSVVGCADSRVELIYPHFKDPEYAIAGNSVYYASTCGECKAGCGVLVESRDGRVIKIEGNPDDPSSRGGTCALGQSSVQGLYDPNRVREPLARVETTDEIGNPIVAFEPVSVNEALSRVATAVKNNKNRFFLSKELDDFNAIVLNEFCSELGFEKAVYEPFNHSDIQFASNEIFGAERSVNYDLSNVRFILSFGAEFLEYWLDPVRFTKQWSFLRKNGLVCHYQIEPRQTLTGSKADKWIPVKPHHELDVALAVLKGVVKLRAGSLPRTIESAVLALDEDELVAESGVPKAVVNDIVQNLISGGPSVVLGGGIQARGTNSLALEKVCLLINHCLDNIGRTVLLSDGPHYLSKYSDVINVIRKIKSLEGQGAVVCINGSFGSWLPSSVAFSELNKLAKPGLVVVFADILDSSCEVADIILPLSHWLESFSFSQKGDMVRLTQPAMLPLFNTRPLSEYLWAILKALQPNHRYAQYTNGHELFLGEARKLLRRDVTESDFEKGFVSLGSSRSKTTYKIVALNTDFLHARSANSKQDKGVKDGHHRVDKTEASGDKTIQATFSDSKQNKDEHHDVGLKLIPVGSVKSWDGRGQNRGWLQEMHDPVSLVCWDGWVELSPKTAKKLKLRNKDIVLLTTRHGEVEVQVVINRMMLDGVVAVPVGISDSSKRLAFASLVSKANGFRLFEYSDQGQFILPEFTIRRTVSFKKAYQAQVTRSEEGRDLIKVKQLLPNFGEYKPFGEHEHHHEIVDLYKQREHPVFKWGMTVDLAACTGCSACVVACYAENNIPVVGPRISAQGRRMSWITIHSYEKRLTDSSLRRVWVPLMCQQCNNAPCEPVCPVYATYHNEEGLNAMIYNRCVGTRYCANNCVYKVRRFNWFEYEFPETLKLQLNPDVTKRGVGVMEKCNFCIQRIQEGKAKAKKEGRLPRDGEIKTACQQACPADAIVFGNLNDPDSKVSRLSRSDRGWKLIDDYVNTKPSVTYLADIVLKV